MKKFEKHITGYWDKELYVTPSYFGEPHLATPAQVRALALRYGADPEEAVEDAKRESSGEDLAKFQIIDESPEEILEDIQLYFDPWGGQFGTLHDLYWFCVEENEDGVDYTQREKIWDFILRNACRADDDEAVAAFLAADDE